MDYFWLRQRRDYLYTPIIEEFYQKMCRKDFNVESAFKIPERNVVYCNTNKKQDFIDILDQQLFLVSNTVKHVFQMYEKNISYKFFCILNNITGEYGTYYAPIISAIDCLEGTDFKCENDITLRQEAIGSTCIFKIRNSEREMVVVRLDVAESLLRRKVQGLELKRFTLS